MLQQREFEALHLLGPNADLADQFHVGVGRAGDEDRPWLDHRVEASRLEATAAEDCGSTRRGWNRSVESSTRMGGTTGGAVPRHSGELHSCLVLLAMHG